MSRTIGFIGSGMIGGTVARLAVAAGYDVVLSNSRDPRTLDEVVAELGPHARAATPAAAARAADLLVAAIPLTAFGALPAADLAGRIVLDTANYYPERDGHLAELDSAAMTSSALLQRTLPGSRIVKAFNTITPHQLATLARPADAPDRSALPLAADDPAALFEATAFLDRIGYDAVEVGPLADSWRMEPGTPAYVEPYLGHIPAVDVAEFLTWTYHTPGLVIPRTRLRDLLDGATRQRPADTRFPSANQPVVKP
ncbi:NAD(P)-binding domain-containing protein [Nocardia yamanashiensis]|uniref:NADPH-dependent F420 reductase n=1 Tax=Nocardia yamanashiensis TaxID=209247 RepID=UPI001E5534C9|nr:NAD(P)-binding domain-containing protein [Nocardia yamanashiensis]UGT42693.1 NAD(P)-binding domain-containing protein [Nocardia yamanashiensis]